MDKEVLDMIMNHIMKLEGTIRQDIREIKEDLRVLKESQVKLAEVVVKLSNVEDKYNMQLNVCKEARKTVENIKEELRAIDKRIIPLENFFEDFKYIKRKLFVGVMLAILTGLATFVLNVIRMLK